ncbi:hypothetical protein [Microseira wollei]|uniref:Uncharacterized protein n=1 Tax=Microseira wollei NIES-4236 TaxID=2530354 RepID=A0AAV3XLH1_9CYAN|nr:hypothetical protein [Microseira wollei]GET43324.1 hypothetical protein MiSe_81460 [Microseira wollei NIES-4236]
MSENLPANANETLDAATIEALTASGIPANRMILIGTKEWITGVIRNLHAVGFAEVGAWSKLVPTRNKGEMISILMRRRSQDQI